MTPYSLSSAENPPIEIQNFRQYIQQADAVIICTPEYIFSIPSCLKNALEWSVSTTIFSEKPTVLMTASADGQKGHAELILIMQTLSAKFDLSTTLLISGIKGKFNNEGEIIDSILKQNLAELMNNLAEIVAK
ncbi:NADPH-dependent FMN reductase [Emticicia oligotrophica]|uniref:NADPH-dependent FMN reductase n=1 Tax=Emticicia oligotrophica TaxID=312279 RepID=UPI000315225B|nr:NAD(P)H-dependent oxidoreductase [Emticicia oligotrophica]